MKITKGLKRIFELHERAINLGYKIDLEKGTKLSKQTGKEIKVYGWTENKTGKGYWFSSWTKAADALEKKLNKF